MLSFRRGTDCANTRLVSHHSLPPVRTKKRHVPRLEPLEQRLVLSNYWVSPSGNDSNAGTQQAPWATPQHAANVVQAGDDVDILAGTYDGFNIPTSGTQSAPITFHAEPGAIIDSVTTWGGANAGINASNQSYIVIDGFTFTPQAGSAYWYSAVRLSGTPGNWVYGNVIENCTAQMRSVAAGDTGSDADQLGLYMSWSNGGKILNNIVSGCWDSSIYAANSSLNYTISGNTVFNCGGNGIHNNGDVGQGSPGINYNALIENNIIYNVSFGIGGQAISCDGVQNSTIQNNLIYNVHGKGISLYQVDAADGSKNDIVVNNTVVTASDGGSALRMVDNSTGNTVLNNILYSANPTSGSIDIESGDMVGLTSDYNILTSRVLSDGSNVGFSGWQSYGFDLHSSDTATPAEMFVNPSANNYQELSTSPTIGAGTSTDAPSTDIAGNPRLSGKGYDIGAYEYQAGPVSPTVSGETPASGATNVAVSTAPTAKFSEPVQANPISFVLSGPHGTTVAGIVSYSSTTDTATFTPSATLAGSTSYTARVSGAETQSGAAMASPVTWTFTTAPTPTVPTAPPTTVPVVTISNVQSVLKIKNRRVVTQVLITFSGAINAGEAHLLRFYRLTVAGKDGSFTARNARAVRLQSAVYDTANNTVTLTSSEPFSLAKPLQLIIFGKPPSGLKDDLGRFIDGGTNVVAILSRSGVTITQ